MNPVSAALFARIRDSSATLALVDGDVALTFGALGDAVDRAAAAFAAAGIGPGSRVGVTAAPAATYVRDLHALLALDSLVVPLPAAMSDWERGRIVDRARLTHLVLAEVPAGAVDRVRRLPADPAPVVGAGVAQLTSGTTGHVKLAVRSAEALLAEVRSYEGALGLDPDAHTVVCALSLHHAYGSGLCAFAALLSGVPVTYCRPLPAAVHRALGQGVGTLFPVVPTLLRVFAAAAEAPPAARGLTVLTAGERLDRRTAAMAEERLRCELAQVYGTSETGLLCMGAAAGPDEACATVGRPAPGVEVAIWPRADRHVGDGVGDVAVTSASLLSGYLEPDGLDESCIEGGWFRTGDIGRVTAGGALVLSGRRSCAINVAGVKVSPEEVEAAILEFPGVESVLVSGARDGLDLERVKAVVTPLDVDLVALQAFCNRRLSGPRVPQLYEAVPSLATTPTGKVVRPIAAGG